MSRASRAREAARRPKAPVEPGWHIVYLRRPYSHPGEAFYGSDLAIRERLVCDCPKHVGAAEHSQDCTFLTLRPSSPQYPVRVRPADTYNICDEQRVAEARPANLCCTADLNAAKQQFFDAVQQRRQAESILRTVGLMASAVKE